MEKTPLISTLNPGHGNVHICHTLHRLDIHSLANVNVMTLVYVDRCTCYVSARDVM